MIDNLYYDINYCDQTAKTRCKSNDEIELRGGYYFFDEYKQKYYWDDYLWYIYYNDGWTIEDANIPDSIKFMDTFWPVTAIDSFAFYDRTSLKSIRIPQSVTSIGGGAFAECTGLLSVTCYATKPPRMRVASWKCIRWDRTRKLPDYETTDFKDNSYTKKYGVFGEVDCSQIPLYVPRASVEAYKSADQWKDFYIKNIEGIYSISFLNWDNSVLLAIDVSEDSIPVYKGSTPTRPENAEFIYTFAGWTPKIVAVTGDATYTATYTSKRKSYAITWQNEDGSLIDKTMVEYGVMPKHADPVKPNTAEYTYTFTGWTPKVVAVTGNATYRATFKATKRKYAIIFKNDDGTELKRDSLEYGVMPITPPIPTKRPTSNYVYTFAGWTPKVVAATANATYTATYNSTSVSSINIPNNQFTLISRKDGSIVGLNKIASHQTLEYSFDCSTWTNMTTTTTISLNNGVSLYVRGKLTGDNTESDYTQFALTGQLEAKGNINYIWDYENLNAPLKKYCGYKLFYLCEGLTTAPKLPATTVTQGCYYAMFHTCENLIAAPELPATNSAVDCYRSMFHTCKNLKTTPTTLPAMTLANYCYYAMFFDCSSITAAPELPATTVANSCYESMFFRCTALENAPELPATNSAKRCYMSMFNGCNSLTTAPTTLPALTLEESCYQSMFKNCSKITSAPTLPALKCEPSCYRAMFQECTSLKRTPSLPATKLAANCYYQMFSYCSSLSVATELPAVTLADRCYYGMFKGTCLVNAPKLPATTLAEGCYMTMFLECSSLTEAPSLPSTELAVNCYRSMFDGCSALTTVPAVLPALTLADTCYRSMFNGCTSITKAPVLPAKTLTTQSYFYMFRGCSSLNYIKCLATNISASGCTSEWVKNVASTGTFVYPTSMTAWTNGVNGIPNGWAIEKVSPYVVRFDANGGTFTPTSFRNTPNGHASGMDAGHKTGYVVVYGGKTSYNSISTFLNATRETYTFLGWYTAKTGGEQVYDATGHCVAGTYWDSNNKWKGTADLQLYAHWGYTITWLNDDGSLIDRTTVESGKIPTHENPSKAETAEQIYTFTGWTPKIVAATSNATYTATYSVTKKYTLTTQAENGTVTKGGVYLDGSIVTITATPNYGYHFIQWSDGNTSNPRTITITRNMTLTAVFAIDKSGTCGKDNALTWSYDDKSKTLTITGNGELTENYTYGIEAPTQMNTLIIGDGVTAIGDRAFYGMTTINHLFIGANVASIGNYAFAECRNFDDITCYAITVPTINATTFANVGNKQYIYLYVPENRERAYKRDDFWGEFDIRIKGTETTTIDTKTITVVPSDNTALFTWPIDNDAASYSLQITKDGVVLCTLTFNSNGQLIGIAFAPSRNGAAHAQAATMSLSAMSFTVTGLNSASKYAYRLSVTDGFKNVIQAYSGEFATTGYNGVVKPGGTPEINPEGLEDALSTGKAHKILRDGQIFIIRGDKVYTVTGQEVK